MKKLRSTFIILLWFIAGASVMFLGTTVKNKLQIDLQTPTPTPVHVLDPYKIYDLVNDYRSSKGLSKLLFNPAMCSFAEERLKQIHTDWSHKGYEEAVNNNLYCVNHGTSGLWCGENLGKDFYTENDQLYAWLASPEHLANIVKPEFKQTCVATDLVNGSAYVVQEFASNF
jgi:uncharacterized protein YkwD